MIGEGCPLDTVGQITVVRGKEIIEGVVVGLDESEVHTRNEDNGNISTPRI